MAQRYLSKEELQTNRKYITVGRLRDILSTFFDGDRVCADDLRNLGVSDENGEPMGYILLVDGNGEYCSFNTEREIDNA